MAEGARRYPLARDPALIGARLFRNIDDPGEMLILFDWDDLHRARLNSQFDELHGSLRMAGIIEDPHVWILEHMGDAPS